MTTLNDIKTLAKYCHQRAPRDLDEVVATLDSVWRQGNSNVAHRATECALLLLYKEGWERQRRGRPDRNAANIADMSFQYLAAEALTWRTLAKQWSDLKPSSYGALTMLANATLATASCMDAEPYYAQMRAARKGDPYTVTNFDPAFHDELEASAENAKGELPVVTTIQDNAADCRRLIYSAFDYAYYKKFGWALCASVARHAGDGIGLHLHLFDIRDSEVGLLEDSLKKSGVRHISISREWTNLRPDADSAATPQAAKNYYHAMRFHRFWMYLTTHPEASAWLLDADMMFTRPSAGLFELLDGNDLGLWLLPGKLEPYNKVVANCVGIAPTPAGRQFIRRVAGYIAACHRAGICPWGADQTVLFCVLMVMQSTDRSPRVAALPAEILDGRYLDTRMIWATKSEPGDPFHGAIQSRLELLKAS